MSKSNLPRLVTGEKPPNPDLKGDLPLPAGTQRNGRKTWKRRLSGWSRWLHIYLSMFSYVILFFFAVTGITLNHADWWTGHPKTRQIKGQLDTAWVKTGDTASIHKAEVVAYLQKKYSLKGALRDFISDDYQCTVSFKGPGYSADIFVNRENGEFELDETKNGFVAVLNDLHKGRDSGSAWAKVIDISAVIMVLVSVTGLLMLLFLKKRRLSGLVLLVMGFLLSWLAWLWWVP